MLVRWICKGLADIKGPTELKYLSICVGFTLTPLTVNKMVCLYFYHPGGAPWFSWFFVFLFGAISVAFLCVPACFFWCGFPVFFVVLFLVSFGDFAGGIFCAFPGAFSTVFWCFFPCIFSCLSLFFSIYVSPWWWSCFLPCFFWWFLGAFFRAFLRAFFRVFFLCFFCAFYRAFFRAFFRSFSCLFSCFFFRALGGTQDKQPQYFAFWPVRFLVLFLVVTTSEDRKYTIYVHRYIHIRYTVYTYWYYYHYKDTFLSVEKVIQRACRSTYIQAHCILPNRYSRRWWRGCV